MPAVELRVIGGSQSGSTIPLTDGKFIIGREHDCQLRPNSELVSRHHCVFTVDAYAVRLRDLGSTNGTYVNGERIRGTALLKAGDRVLVGKLDVQVVIDGQPATVAEETMHAQRDETVVAGKRVPGVPAKTDSGFDLASMSDELSSLEDETGVRETTAAANVSGTVVITGPEAQEVAAASAAAPAGMPPGYPPGPWMQPPGYPYPPAYPQYPGMPAYGYGYPYPGMPPMPQIPGMAQYPPGYGYPAPPQAAPAAVEEVPPAAASEFPEFRLPDPATTGAKAPAPPPPPKPEDAGKPKAHIPSAAQDIINSYLNRRPKT